MSTLVKRAKLLAEFVHLDEKRRGGEPYFNHCRRVARSCEETENTQCAAYLHDVLENAIYPNDIRMLILTYFPLEVLTIVEILTHNKTKCSYNTYIEVICNHPAAFEIKIADLCDNTRDEIPEKQKAKYRSACITMINKKKIIPTILLERLNIEE